MALGLACSTPSDPGDPRACRQTYEFGNYGCADIIGRVVGDAGQPLAGVSIGPRFLPDSVDAGSYNTVYTTTGADGRFTLRLHRFGRRRVIPAPDTLSLYIEATIPPMHGAISAASDSILVQAALAPIGQVPRPATAEIQLDHP